MIFKKFSRSVFSSAMILSVFFSTVGIPVYGHSCSEAGISKVSIFKIKSCCGESREDEGCCSSTVSVNKVESEKQVARTLVVQSPLVDFIYFIPTFSGIEKSQQTFGRIYFEEPPPDPGRFILIKNSISRI